MNTLPGTSFTVKGQRVNWNRRRNSYTFWELLSCKSRQTSWMVEPTQKSVPYRLFETFLRGKVIFRQIKRKSFLDKQKTRGLKVRRPTPFTWITQAPTYTHDPLNTDFVLGKSPKRHWSPC